MPVTRAASEQPEQRQLIRVPSKRASVEPFCTEDSEDNDVMPRRQKYRNNPQDDPSLYRHRPRLDPTRPVRPPTLAPVPLRAPTSAASPATPVGVTRNNAHHVRPPSQPAPNLTNFSFALTTATARRDYGVGGTPSVASQLGANRSNAIDVDSEARYSPEAGDRSAPAGRPPLGVAAGVSAGSPAGGASDAVANVGTDGHGSAADGSGPFSEGSAAADAGPASATVADTAEAVGHPADQIEDTGPSRDDDADAGIEEATGLDPAAVYDPDYYADYEADPDEPNPTATAGPVAAPAGAPGDGEGQFAADFEALTRDWATSRSEPPASTATTPNVAQTHPNTTDPVGCLDLASSAGPRATNQESAPAPSLQASQPLGAASAADIQTRNEGASGEANGNAHANGNANNDVDPDADADADMVDSEMGDDARAGAGATAHTADSTQVAADVDGTPRAAATAARPPRVSGRLIWPTPRASLLAYDELPITTSPLDALTIRFRHGSRIPQGSQSRVRETVVNQISAFLTKEVGGPRSTPDVRFPGSGSGKEQEIDVTLHPDDFTRLPTHNIPLIISGEAARETVRSVKFAPNELIVQAINFPSNVSCQSAANALFQALHPHGHIVALYEQRQAYLATSTHPGGTRFNGTLLAHVRFTGCPPDEMPVDSIAKMPGWLPIEGHRQEVELLYPGRYAWCRICKSRAAKRHTRFDCPRAPCVLCRRRGHTGSDCPMAANQGIPILELNPLVEAPPNPAPPAADRPPALGGSSSSRWAS